MSEQSTRPTWAYPVVRGGRTVVYFIRKEYDKVWENIHKQGRLGLAANPGFLKALREAFYTDNQRRIRITNVSVDMDYEMARISVVSIDVVECLCGNRPGHYLPGYKLAGTCALNAEGTQEPRRQAKRQKQSARAGHEGAPC
jgi:hypothetical protein